MQVSSSGNASIIIVNFNSGPLLARCLAALADQTFRDFEVIVLDNASTDDSAVAAAAVLELPHEADPRPYQPRLRSWREPCGPRSTSYPTGSRC